MIGIIDALEGTLGYVLGAVILIVTIIFMLFTPGNFKLMYKKLYKRTLIIAFILILGLPSVTLGINLYRQQEYKTKYTQIQEMLLEFEKEDMSTISDYIDYLPEDYKDIHEIKDDYEYIKENVDVIEKHDVRVEHLKMRDAYYKLARFDEKSQDYNLSGYLDTVDRDVLILQVNWTNDNGDYFQVELNEINPNRSTLYTSLPDERETGKEYYYFLSGDWEVIGIKNVEDFTDRFNAYRIERISVKELTLYCYKDGKTYTLYSDDYDEFLQGFM